MFFRTAAVSIAVLASLTASPLPASTPVALPDQRGPEKLELTPDRVPYVKGELLVRFRDGVSRSERGAVHDRHGAKRKDRIRSAGLDVVELPKGVSEHTALLAYERDPLVADAALNLLRRPLDVPNDPRFPEQWAHVNTGQAHPIADPPPSSAAGRAGADVDTDAAWDEQEGSASTVIVVLDTGVDIAHPDIAPNLWVNPNEIPADSIDNDGNGYVDDVHGCDFTDDICSSLIDSPPTKSVNAHGTHVAGIAAAEADNAIGIAGACPGCSIMVLKIGDHGLLPVDAEIEAIEYLRAMKAVLPGSRFIVNASFGGPVWEREEYGAIKRLAADGVLFVAAAGNSALDNDLSLGGPGLFADTPSFPASYDLPNVISVAASNHRDHYGYETGCRIDTGSRSACLFTNWGRRSVDLAAPGVDITSTFPGSQYRTWNGTSMAAPLAAGVAGLVWSDGTALSAVEVRAKVLNGVSRPGALDDLRYASKRRTGAFTATRDGRLDADGALAASSIRGSGVHDGTISGAIRIRDQARGSVAWPDDVNDVYKKVLRPGVFRVVLRAGDRDLDLFVWKPGTTEIWQYEQGCFGFGGGCKLMAKRASPSGTERIKRMRVTSKGRYSFHVAAFLFQKGPYTLRIKRIE